MYDSVKHNQIQEQTRESDNKMDNIVRRGILDVIRERNASWLECQNILTRSLIPDITKLIAEYTYGENDVVPEIAAFNLTRDEFNIEVTLQTSPTIKNGTIKWEHWSRAEMSEFFHYQNAYYIGLNESDDRLTSYVDMFEMIDFILTGFSFIVFKDIMWMVYDHRHNKFDDINFESDDSIVALGIMHSIRARFLACE